jgi:thioredoxin 1
MLAFFSIRGIIQKVACISLFKEASMASDAVLTLTDANFDRDVLQSDLPVLVDFWATWCAPCKAIGPLIDSVAADYAGKLKVGKVNVDDNPATPGKYGVRGIPTLILFKGGKVVDQVVGAVPKSQLDALIAKAL